MTCEIIALCAILKREKYFSHINKDFNVETFMIFVFRENEEFYGVNRKLCHVI